MALCGLIWLIHVSNSGHATVGKSLFWRFNFCINHLLRAGKRQRTDWLGSELKNKALAKDRILLDEQVIERNPEIIIGSWCGKMFKPEKVKQRIGFENVKAVQQNHLYEIKSELILQPGPAALTDGLDKIVEIIKNFTLK